MHVNVNFVLKRFHKVVSTLVISDTVVCVVALTVSYLYAAIVHIIFNKFPGDTFAMF